MRVIKLIAKNIERLKGVQEVEPPRNLVLVTGKNKQGKSSLIHSILYSLGGKRAISDKPIHKGEDSAEIETHFGDYTIKRTFTENGTYLTVTQNGEEVKGGQRILDELYDKLYFDVLKFMEMSGKEQKAMFLKALGIDLSKEEEKYDKIYDERRMVGRERRKAKAQLSSVEKPDEEVLKSDKVSVSELIDKRDDMSDKLNKVKGVENDIANYQENIYELEREISDLKQQIRNKQERIKKYGDKIDEINSKLQDVDVECIRSDMEKINNQIENAEEINNEIDEAQKWKSLKEEYVEKDNEYKDLSLKLEEIEVEKSMKLRNANLPKQIDVSQDGLLYNDLPFEQQSGAESLITCVQIASMIKKEFQVLLITNPPQLDKDMLNTIRRVAEKFDYQIWLEYVEDEDSGLGIYIEDGQVKNNISTNEENFE